MKITLDLTSQECELLIYALALRAKQEESLAKKGYGISGVPRPLASKIEAAAIEVFGWDKAAPGFRFDHDMYPMERVTVSFYKQNTNRVPGGVR